MFGGESVELDDKNAGLRPSSIIYAATGSGDGIEKAQKMKTGIKISCQVSLDLYLRAVTFMV